MNPTKIIIAFDVLIKIIEAVKAAIIRKGKTR